MSEPRPPGRAVRGRLNSAFLAAAAGYVDRKLGGRKRALFAGLPGRVVEIGAGTGANLRYLAPGTEVVAVEPNPHMHDRLRAEADRRGVGLEVLPVGAEALPLEDGSVEAVVGTWVVCTVADPGAVLAEVRRVLRPGGRFAFVEHAAAPPRTALRGLQGALRGPWRWAFEGCHLDRDPAGLIEAAGFAAVEAERFALPTLVAPVRPHVAGVATA